MNYQPIMNPYRSAIIKPSSITIFPSSNHSTTTETASCHGPCHHCTPLASLLSGPMRCDKPCTNSNSNVQRGAEQLRLFRKSWAARRGDGWWTIGAIQVKHRGLTYVYRWKMHVNWSWLSVLHVYDKVCQYTVHTYNCVCVPFCTNVF